MIITIANQKGGSGKSTLAINMAIKLLESSKILVLDTDPQKSIETFTNIRESDEKASLGLKHFTLSNRTGNIAETIKQVIEIYDHIIIDTRGSDSQEGRKAMLYADALIIPTIPSQFDMDVLVSMFARVKEIKDFNENLFIAVLKNKISPNPFLNKELDDFKGAILEINSEVGNEDFCILNNSLHDRISYKRTISDGLGITEYSDTKAKEEFEAFMVEFLNAFYKKNEKSA